MKPCFVLREDLVELGWGDCKNDTSQQVSWSEGHVLVTMEMAGARDCSAKKEGAKTIPRMKFSSGNIGPRNLRQSA